MFVLKLSGIQMNYPIRDSITFTKKIWEVVEAYSPSIYLPVYNMVPFKNIHLYNGFPSTSFPLTYILL